MKKSGHSVEDFYKKAEVLHTKALELHRERYRTVGTYDELACTVLLDDIRSLARDIERGSINLDIEFGS